MQDAETLRHEIDAALKECQRLIFLVGPDAEKHARIALQKSVQIQDDEMETLSYCALSAVQLYVMFDYLKGLELARLAVGKSENLPDGYAKISAYYQAATANQNLRDYVNALYYLRECERMLESVPDIPEYWVQLNGVNHSFGTIFSNFGLYEFSKGFLEKSLLYAEKLKNENLIRRSRISLGHYFFHTKKYDSAIAEYSKVIDEFKNLPEQENMAVLFHYLGLIYKEKGAYEEAEKNYLRAFEIRKRIGNETRLAYSYYGLGMLYHAMKRSAEANENFEKAKTIFEKYPEVFSEANRNEVYADIYALMGDYKKAYEHFSKLQLPHVDRSVIEKTFETLFENEKLKQDKIREEAEQIKKLNDDMRDYAKQLEISNKDLKTYAHTASHDLREPLRMISAYMSILEAKLKDKLTQEEKQFLHFAVDGSKRMDEMITRILQSAKGNQTSFKPVDLNKVAAQVKTNLAKLMAEKNATVEFADLPVVLADDIQMMQVLQNLVTNAIKYNTSTSPSVNISSVQNAKSVSVFVADNGVGIPENMRGKVFEMFSRVENASGAEGTGIGLSTVKNIIEKMKGNIRIESNKMSGTVFVIELPKV